MKTTHFFLSVFFMFLVLALNGQIRPDQAPTKTPSRTDAIYTQEGGPLRKILFSAAKVFFADSQRLSISGQVLSISGGNSVTLPTVGTVGGDLSGSLPNPTVSSIQGRSVSATAPTSGQLYKWNGTTWTPSSDLDAQTLSLSGQTLTLSNGNSVTLPNYLLISDTTLMLAPCIKSAGWGLIKSTSTLRVDSILVASRAYVRTQITNLNLGTTYFSLTGGSITGTAGAGFFGMLNQSAAPSTVSGGLALYSDASNRFSVKDASGFVYGFAESNTADRLYTLQNATGTIPLLQSTQTWTGVNTFSAVPIIDGTSSNNLIDAQSGGSAYAGITFRNSIQDFAGRIYTGRSTAANSIIFDFGTFSSSPSPSAFAVKFAAFTTEFGQSGNSSFGHTITMNKRGIGVNYPLVLQNAINTTATGTGLIFSAADQNGTTQTSASIQSIKNNVSAGNITASLGFSTSDGASLSEKMRISDLGNLLLGTTTDNTLSLFTTSSTTKGSRPFPTQTSSQINANYGAISTVGTLVGGSGYTAGTYTSIALTGSSTGTGALATIVVTGSAVSSVTITTAGTGYNVGDVLSASNAVIGGGAGSGFTINVTAVNTPAALMVYNSTTNAPQWHDGSKWNRFLSQSLTSPLAASQIATGDGTGNIVGSTAYTNGTKLVLGLSAFTNPQVDLVVPAGGTGAANEAFGFRIRDNSTSGNTRYMTFGLNNTARGGSNQGYGYIQHGFWGGGNDNVLILQPDNGRVVIGNSGATARFALTTTQIGLMPASGTFSGIGTTGGSLVFTHNLTALGAAGIFALQDKSLISQGLGLLFKTDASADITNSTGVERMRLSSDGYLSLGNGVSPTSQFQINSTYSNTGNLSGDGYGLSLRAGTYNNTSTVGTNGIVAGTIAGGSGYVSATYTNVALTGGTGSGATATITVAGGVVTQVVLGNRGINFTVADVLTTANTNLGGSGSGFTYTLTSVNGSANTVASGSAASIGIPTITSTNTGVMYTKFSTLNILGEPVSSTNTTFTNRYAFNVESGRSFFGGDIWLSTSSVGFHQASAGATIFNFFTTGGTSGTINISNLTGLQPGNVAFTDSGGGQTTAGAYITTNGSLHTYRIFPLGGANFSFVGQTMNYGSRLNPMSTFSFNDVNDSSTGTPQTATIRGGSASGLTANTNGSGGNISISGGLGAGSGTDGVILFTTGNGTAAAGTVHTGIERARITGTGQFGLGASSINALSLFDAVSTTLGSRPFPLQTTANIAANYSAIATLGSITGGTLYTTGTYSGVSLTGGTGTGATANITVNGSGNVSVVTIVAAGSGYAVGDILSASAAAIGGTGSGFSVPVATINTPAGLFVYNSSLGRLQVNNADQWRTIPVLESAQTFTATQTFQNSVRIYPSFAASQNYWFDAVLNNTINQDHQLRYTMDGGTTMYNLIRAYNINMICLGTGGGLGPNAEPVRITNSGITFIDNLHVNPTNTTSGPSNYQALQFSRTAITSFLASTSLSIKNSLTFNSAALIFSTGDFSTSVNVGTRPVVERARITETGQFLIGANTTTAGVKLHINSTTSGLLPPRLTTTQRDNLLIGVTGVTINTGGSGYTASFPAVFLTGGGEGVEGTVNVSAGAVTSVTITKSGSGFTSAPTVNFHIGNGTGATATATIGTITLPTGLTIFNTTTNRYNIWDGSTWVAQPTMISGGITQGAVVVGDANGNLIAAKAVSKVVQTQNANYDATSDLSINNVVNVYADQTSGASANTTITLPNPSATYAGQSVVIYAADAASGFKVAVSCSSGIFYSTVSTTAPTTQSTYDITDATTSLAWGKATLTCMLLPGSIYRWVVTTN